MFDVGFWEIMVISILAMVVIGPERLPKVAKTVGHWFGKTRRFVEGVKSEVESEFDASELKRLMHNQEVQIKELQSKLNEETGDFRKGFSYDLDDNSKDDQNNNDIDDDYLEFLDEDEEKDHEQIAAEKKAEQERREAEHREATARVQKERLEARAAQSDNQNNSDDDAEVASLNSEQSKDKHDG